MEEEDEEEDADDETDLLRIRVLLRGDVMNFSWEFVVSCAADRFVACVVCCLATAFALRCRQFGVSWYDPSSS